MTVNNQYFTEEQIKAGQMQKLLDFLTAEAYSAGDYYNDIRIHPADCGAFIVEWVQIPWDHSFGGHFEYIGEDQIVMIEKIFPDNHYEQCFDEDDYQERLAEWLKCNPGWIKTSYGTWTNEIENEKIRKELEKESIVYYNDKPVGVSNEDWAEIKLKEAQKELHFENGIPQGE